MTRRIRVDDVLWGKISGNPNDNNLKTGFNVCYPLDMNWKSHENSKEMAQMLEPPGSSGVSICR
jgi:hypothetical protein